MMSQILTPDCLRNSRMQKRRICRPWRLDWPLQSRKGEACEGRRNPTSMSGCENLALSSRSDPMRSTTAGSALNGRLLPSNFRQPKPRVRTKLVGTGKLVGGWIESRSAWTSGGAKRRKSWVGRQRKTSRSVSVAWSADPAFNFDAGSCPYSQCVHLCTLV